jgi:ABC-2 type transport system permease protein
MTTLRSMRYALLSGWYDYVSVYTWQSWLGGWFVRALAQVSFFALIGRLSQSEQQETNFLLIGNAIVLVAMQALFAVHVISWERVTGTLPLHAVSPTSPVLALASRGLYLIIDGSISALGALFLLAPVFSVPLPWPHVLLVIPLTILAAASSYSLGIFLGIIGLAYRSTINVLVNFGQIAIMTLCGVDVPLSIFPRSISWISQCLPVTHGLTAIHDVLANHTDGIAGQALLEAAVGICWLGLCLVTFRWFVRRARRNGSLEYFA